MKKRKGIISRMTAVAITATLFINPLTTFAANTEETPGLQLQTIVIDNNGNNWKTESWGGQNVIPNTNWTTLTIRDYYENGYLNFDIRSLGNDVQSFNIGLTSKRHNVQETLYWTEEMAGVPLSAGTDWTSFSLRIKDLIDANPDSNFSLDDFFFIFLMRTSGNADMELRNVTITSSDDERQYPIIKVNQVGYALNGEKIAYVSCFSKFGSLNGKQYEIVNADTNEVVYTGILPDADADDPVSGERVHEIRFDDFNEVGTFYIRISDTGLDPSVRSPRDVAEGLDVENIESYKFNISANVYDGLMTDLIHYYYLQRQGIDLEEKYAGEFARENLHPGDSTVKKWSDRDNANAETYDVSGGWYDAGDYGKYTCPAASSLSDLFFAYELFPEVFNRLTINIPETDPTNPRYVDAPGFLSELKWELDMLMKLEHPSKDGSFYIAANYSGDTIYIEDTLKRSSTGGAESELRSHDATASAAAIFAHSYLVYKNVPAYADFADECLEVSLRAWEWLNDPSNEKHMSIDAANRTYTFTQDGLDRGMFWAAGAIYRAVKESGGDASVYENYMIAHAHDESVLNCFQPYNSLGYGHSGESFLGFVHYLYENDDPAKEIKDTFEQFNSWKSERIKTNVWGTAVPSWGYWWGSNKMIAQSATSFVLGSVITEGKDSIPDDVIQSINGTANYLLGANPISFSYVSGNGENCVENIFSGIYSRDKLLDPYQIPAGCFTEGTNIYDNRHLSKFDGKCYIDSDGEFTTNENTLYGNAAMVLLMASVMSQSQESIIGDVNSDGEFNIADVVVMQKWVLAVPGAVLADWKAGDLCEDSRIDSFDLCLMRRELLKQIDK